MIAQESLLRRYVRKHSSAGEFYMRVNTTEEKSLQQKVVIKTLDFPQTTE